MTIKLKSYQLHGIKVDKLVDKWEFCCWQDLFNWLKRYSELNKCPKCKRKK